jgi:penicillin-binding protein 1A
MGRDDARPVAGLAGGRAPARAFAAYMARAVGGTPPESLVTDIDGGEPIIEPDDAVYGLSEGEAPPSIEVGPDGRPTVPGNIQQPEPDQPRDSGPINDQWLDRTLKDGQQLPNGG